MSPYESPQARRQALEERIRERSRAGPATAASRLRRAAVFESVARRLVAAEPGRWVVKGGMALEWRYGDVARTTRDLDLCVDAPELDAAALRERIVRALAADIANDHFRFEVGEPERLQEDVQGRPGRRFGVVALLGGRRFEGVRLDVVPRLDEVAFREAVTRPSAFEFAGLPPITVELAAPAQHFAEKVHALTRPRGDRPNSRVHDLVDLVLLIERGDVAIADASEAVAHVFRVCGTHAIPEEIPDPPSSWRRLFPSEAEASGVSVRELDPALIVLREFWRRVRPTPERNLERG